jgi:hypothetical protein
LKNRWADHEAHEQVALSSLHGASGSMRSRASVSHLVIDRGADGASGAQPDGRALWFEEGGLWRRVIVADRLPANTER